MEYCKANMEEAALRPYLYAVRESVPFWIHGTSQHSLQKFFALFIRALFKLQTGHVALWPSG